MIAVVGSLSSDVGDEWLERHGRDGLGPVADLPDEPLRLGACEMERATRGSLEAVSDLRDGDAGRMTDEDMDVVSGVSGGHELAVERAGLSFEEGGKPGVEARLEPRDSLAGGPDEVDDEDGRGMGMPGDERKERTHPWTFDTFGAMLRGRWK
jgi:hypothetical protein